MKLDVSMKLICGIKINKQLTTMELQLPTKKHLLQVIEDSVLNIEYHIVKVDFEFTSMICLEKYEDNDLVEIKKLF